MTSGSGGQPASSLARTFSVFGVFEHPSRMQSHLDFEVAKDILIFTVVENYAFCRPCTQLAINKGFEMPMLLGCLVEGVRNLICQIRI